MRFFEEHSRRIYFYCLRQLGSREEAEDALQATYLNAWRSLRRGFRPERPRSWLFGIAHNVCLSRLRSRLRQGAVDLRDPDDLEATVPGAEYKGDELIGLSAALAALPKRQRHAFLLREWRGLSYEEIASELELSDSAVATLIFRARRAVEASLDAPAARRRPLARSLGSLFGLASLVDGVRSALASHAHAKVAVVLALGATAPLVMFGLVEGHLERLGAPAPEGGAPPIIHRSLPQAPSSLPAPVAEPLARAGLGARRGAGPAPTPEEPPPSLLAAATVEPPAVSSTPPAEPPSGDAPSEPPQPTPSPAPAETEPEPAPEPESQPDPEPAPDVDEEEEESDNDDEADDDNEAEKVTLCHHTSSEKNPFVTITVGEDAGQAHREHGDTLGPCPG